MIFVRALPCLYLAVLWQVFQSSTITDITLKWPLTFFDRPSVIIFFKLSNLRTLKQVQEVMANHMLAFRVLQAALSLVNLVLFTALLVALCSCSFIIRDDLLHHIDCRSANALQQQWSSFSTIPRVQKGGVHTVRFCPFLPPFLTQFAKAFPWGGTFRLFKGWYRRMFGNDHHLMLTFVFI